MEKSTVKLHQKTRVRDEYGGSQEVLNYVRDITGYLVPVTELYTQNNAKVSVESTHKFISDERVAGRNLVVEVDGLLYAVISSKSVYAKGAVMELKNNG